MSELGLALAYLRQRPIAALLHIVLLALGAATVTAVLLVSHQLEDRLLREVRGIDLVVGAKGSPLQLILSAVFQVDVPTGNISLGEAQAVRASPLVATTTALAMGDRARGFRVLGTEPSYLELMGVAPLEGRLWESAFEAVLGAEVAAATGLRLGDSFTSSHGLGERGLEHADRPYRVVGILPPIGRAVDRLVVTALESVWEIHAPHLQRQGPLRALTAAAEEITALLVRYKTPLAAVQLPRQINAQTAMQAASPALEVARLQRLTGAGAEILRAAGFVFCVAAVLGIATTLMSALEQRRYDLALMRALGAGPGRLARIVFLEAFTLTLLGLGLGWIGGHAAVELIDRLVPDAAAAGLSGQAFVPFEYLLGLAIPVAAAAAALVPAARAYRTDVATVLAQRA